MSAEYRLMSDQPSSSFPTTPHDISRLMRTATDAVNDLGDEIPVRSVAEKVTELTQVTRDLVSRYPLRTMGVALTVGFVIGLLCCCGSESDRPSSE